MNKTLRAAGATGLTAASIVAGLGFGPAAHATDASNAASAGSEVSASEIDAEVRHADSEPERRTGTTPPGDEITLDPTAGITIGPGDKIAVGPGEKITLTTTTVTTKQVTAGKANTISGTATPGATLKIVNKWGTDLLGHTVTVDKDGNWSFDRTISGSAKNFQFAIIQTKGALTQTSPVTTLTAQR